MEFFDKAKKKFTSLLERFKDTEKSRQFVEGMIVSFPAAYFIGQSIIEQIPNGNFLEASISFVGGSMLCKIGGQKIKKALFDKPKTINSQTESKNIDANANDFE